MPLCLVVNLVTTFLLLSLQSPTVIVAPSISKVENKHIHRHYHYGSEFMFAEIIVDSMCENDIIYNRSSNKYDLEITSAFTLHGIRIRIFGYTSEGDDG